MEENALVMLSVEKQRHCNAKPVEKAVIERDYSMYCLKETEYRRDFSLQFSVFNALFCVGLPQNMVTK